MHKYISEFLELGQNDAHFIGSVKTYFGPWWRFWNRKVKTEQAFGDDLTREFDKNGNLIHVMRLKSALHSCGVGERYYWETLDVNKMVAVSRPNSECIKKIFPDGQCMEVHPKDSDGIREVVWGRIDDDGISEPYARLFYKGNQQVDCKWCQKVVSMDAWKEALKKKPISMAEKIAVLEKASKEFRKRKKAPKRESYLRAFKNKEAKARAEAYKEFTRKTRLLMRVMRSHPGRSFE